MTDRLRFRDDDPEDAWDADDPPLEQLENLRRRVAALRPDDPNLRDRLRMLAEDTDHVRVRL